MKGADDGDAPFFREPKRLVAGPIRCRDMDDVGVALLQSPAQIPTEPESDSVLALYRKGHRSHRDEVLRNRNHFSGESGAKTVTLCPLFSR